MKARLFGFAIELGSGISFDEFIDHLGTLNATEIKYGEYNRLIYIGEREDYYVGLFLTVKDHKKFCELKDDGTGQYVVKVGAIADGSSFIDFNFFALHKGTMRGLYQHYHNSCSLNQFGIFLKRQYEDLKSARVNAELAGRGGDQATPREKRAADQKFAGSLSWEVMVRKESLGELIDEFDRVTFFEFEYTAFSKPENQFEPIAKLVKKESHTVRFVTGTGPSAVKRAIENAVADLGILKGKVGGRDAEKVEKFLRLVDQPDFFGQFEYDEIADDTILNLKNVEQSPFFGRMFDALGNNRGFFETRTG